MFRSTLLAFLSVWKTKKYEVTYYKRYVDDTLIIFDQSEISEHTILNFMNNVDEHLKFKMSMEENRITNYLDLSINRNANNVDL